MIPIKQEIIQKFIKAYNTFNIDSMLVLLHPEIQFKNISGGKLNTQSSGKLEFEKLARQSAALFKEREQKIISYKESGNKVNLEIQYHAVLAADLPNSLKIGDKIDITGKSEYVFKNGLIYSITDES
jgi:hypothetical protein